MGHSGSNQGPFGLQPNALPLSCIPAANRFKNITANTCRLFEHCYNVFWSESSVLSRSMSFFSSLWKIIQGETRVRSGDLSDCSWLLYHWAISPLHTDSIISLQTRSGCLSTGTRFFVPSQVYSRDRCHFSLSLSKIIQGDTRVRTRDLSDCSQMLYHWAISPLHTDSITSLQTPTVCLSTVTIFFSESSVLSLLISFFSSLSNIIQGDTRVRTRDLSDCSRKLYHWAISPLQTDSKTSLQTRAGCLSTVTMFFGPSQVYSRDQCHFCLVFQKLYKGTPGFGPGTSRTAAECSTTELYPRCIQIQQHHCKHVQVVWALLQCFLFRVKCTLAIDVILL